jgi:hypothetical protein
MTNQQRATAYNLLARVRTDREQAGRAVELILMMLDFLDNMDSPSEDAPVFPGHPLYLHHCKAISDGRPGVPEDAEDDDPRENDDPKEDCDPTEANGDEEDYSACGRC